MLKKNNIIEATIDPLQQNFVIQEQVPFLKEASDIYFLFVTGKEDTRHLRIYEEAELLKMLEKIEELITKTSDKNTKRKYRHQLRVICHNIFTSKISIKNGQTLIRIPNILLELSRIDLNTDYYLFTRQKHIEIHKKPKSKVRARV